MCLLMWAHARQGVRFAHSFSIRFAWCCLQQLSAKKQVPDTDSEQTSCTSIVVVYDHMLVGASSEAGLPQTLHKPVEAV